MSGVRKAVLSDAKAINSLSQSLGYTPATDTVAQARLAEILSSHSDRVWVFANGARITGWIHAFIAVRIASEGFVEIGGLVVDPIMRQQGVGRVLVRQAKSWALENGVSLHVRCNAMRNDSHEFYAAVGFSKVKQQYVFEQNA